MISRFFIDRPIFASVLSIALTIAGGISVFSLPIAQYPPIAPPTVQVSVSYPGASAEVVADTVAAPIEQQVNGVDGMLYMSSTCDNTGYYNLIVTFDLGSDLNTALVAVQNRVNLAVPQLPDTVQRQGLTIKKKSPNILLTVSLFSPNGTYDDIYLSNYATIHLKDELFRLEGVGDLTYLGQRDYSIRVWLDPQQMAARSIASNEVIDALRQQNVAVAPGQVGQPPDKGAQEFQLPIDTLGRLRTVEQFENLIVRCIPGGDGVVAPRYVRLKDVARVEMGANTYVQTAGLDQYVSVGLAIFQLPGTNALDVADRINAKMEQLKKKFPEDLDYKIVYDTTPFIRESVEDVAKTLRDAIVLVAIVTMVFLQSWRAVLIPLIAVPVAIVGTFAVMAALGFSINNISMFGLVLAIGIVVDDAIVVVENVERWLAEGVPPREAAIKAMEEVTGPVVAVALVLCAVFVPCAFITGITGQFFRQFAITIAVSTVFSALNSLTLSPALAAILLKPHGAHRDWLTLSLDATLGRFLFKPFNWAFDKSAHAYARIVGWSLRLTVIVLLIYGGLLYVTGWSFSKVPTGFIPQQDQGWLLVNLQLPDSSSMQRSQEVINHASTIARQLPGVAHTVSTAGYSFLLNLFGSNYASMFVVLKPFDERTTFETQGEVIMRKLRLKYREEITDGVIGVFGAPPVMGLGTAGGFKLIVEDRVDQGPQFLERECLEIMKETRDVPVIAGLFTQYRANTPQLFADIDRAKVRALGVSIRDVTQALQAYIGSTYVNNFNEYGRFWQVNVMADLPFRATKDALNLIKLRNERGEMVPLGTVVDMKEAVGPGMVFRYNLYRAAPLNGGARPGVSSGEAIADMDRICERVLPQTMGTEWTELSYLQIKESEDWRNKIVFPLSVVFVFLVLSALYESWTLPLAVILVVPMCLLCSVIGIAAARMDINIFTQIGLVVLVGLASKNAILIVEFAKQLQTEGKPLFEATTEACRLRLRPIMMTSFAFILGVVPLVIARGAGWEMRRALGTAVFSGMLGVTFFGIFLTPVFYYAIQWLGDRPALCSPTAKRVGWVLYLVLSIATLGIPLLLSGIMRRKTGSSSSPP